VTGTVNEDKHYAVFSHILLYTAITEPVLISTNTVPKPSLVYTQCHVYKNTAETHTQVYISIVMFSEIRRGSKTLWSCRQHYCKLISSQLHVSAILISWRHSKTLKIPQSSEIPSNASALSWCFKMQFSCCACTIHSKTRNVAHQNTTSL